MGMRVNSAGREASTKTSPTSTTRSNEKKPANEAVKAGVRYAIFGSLLLALRALAEGLSQCSLEVRILLDLLRDVGIGFIVLGLFNFAISQGEWEKYFEERLRKIIIDRSFLQSLHISELDKLIRTAIEAQSPGAAINREGGFLEYFEDHLHGFIFDPYREKAVVEISYQTKDACEEVFLVVNKFGYTARIVGGLPHRAIQFGLGPSECVNGGNITVSIRLPEYLGNDTSKQGSTGDIIILEPANRQLEKTKNGDYKIEVPIPESYINVDGLEVMVEASYETFKENIQFWWMLYPTRDLTVTILFPHEYDIHAREFVHVPSFSNWTNWPGYLMFRYHSWILPGGGISWGFSKVQRQNIVDKKSSGEETSDKSVLPE